MLAALHSDINFLTPGLLHLIGRPDSQKGRPAIVKDGIISKTKFFGAISVARYNYRNKFCEFQSQLNQGNFTKSLVKAGPNDLPRKDWVQTT